VSGGLVYIVRHTTTAANVAGKLNSRVDTDLTARGRAEAAALGEALRSVPFARILAAPSRRTRETAEAIRAAQVGPVEVVVEPLLEEVGFGSFEGQTRAEVEQGESAAALADWDSGGSGGNAEPLADAAARAERVMSRLDGLEGPSLFVTHGVFARVLLAACVLEMPVTQYRRLRFDNGICAVVSWTPAFPRLLRLQGLDALDSVADESGFDESGAASSPGS
jgi:broad specificity phosphatase PhoE